MLTVEIDFILRKDTFIAAHLASPRAVVGTLKRLCMMIDRSHSFTSLSSLIRLAFRLVVLVLQDILCLLCVPVITDGCRVHAIDMTIIVSESIATDTATFILLIID